MVVCVYMCICVHTWWSWLDYYICLINYHFYGSCLSEFVLLWHSPILSPQPDYIETLLYWISLQWSDSLMFLLLIKPVFPVLEIDIAIQLLQTDREWQSHEDRKSFMGGERKQQDRGGDFQLKLSLLLIPFHAASILLDRILWKVLVEGWWEEEENWHQYITLSAGTGMEIWSQLKFCLCAPSKRGLYTVRLIFVTGSRQWL